MKRLFLLVLFCPVSLLAADRPNIVFILADDVGREVLGSYGGESYATPHLDALASTGARFEHCYSMPVCHPSRITLLTGRYPRHLTNPRWGDFPADSERQTFAHMAREAGYSTVVAGKWQLCLMKDRLDHPRRLGFDEWSVFGWHEGARYHEPMIYQNGKLRDDTDGKYGPDLYVDFLLDFMKKKKGQPIFAFYSMALCHDVTDDIGKPVPYGSRGRYDNYAEMVAMMDHEVGRLVEGIDQLGLRDNTLILFTTDNGTATRSKLTAVDESGRKFRYETVVSRMNGKQIPGGKGRLTDWGTRVPMIANWPGHIAPGQVWDDLVDFSDFLPTFTGLCQGRLPEKPTLDGISFAPRLMDNEPSLRKWVHAEGRSGRYFARTRRWKLYNDGRFFDAMEDPFEKNRLEPADRPVSSREAYELLSKAVESLNRENRE